MKSFGCCLFRLHYTLSTSLFSSIQLKFYFLYKKEKKNKIKKSNRNLSAYFLVDQNFISF